MSEFSKQMHFDERALCNTSTWHKSLIRLRKSPAIMASGISTIFLPESPDELCDRIKLSLQQNQLETLLVYLMKTILL